jgi:hypothetical protein
MTRSLPPFDVSGRPHPPSYPNMNVAEDINIMTGTCSAQRRGHASRISPPLLLPRTFAATHPESDAGTRSAGDGMSETSEHTELLITQHDENNKAPMHPLVSATASRCSLIPRLLLTAAAGCSLLLVGLAGTLLASPHQATRAGGGGMQASRHVAGGPTALSRETRLDAKAAAFRAARLVNRGVELAGTPMQREGTGRDAVAAAKQGDPRLVAPSTWTECAQSAEILYTGKPKPYPGGSWRYFAGAIPAWPARPTGRSNSTALSPLAPTPASLAPARIPLQLSMLLLASHSRFSRHAPCVQSGPD